MKKGTIFGWAVAVFAAAALTGCGGGSSDSTATTTTTTTYDVTVERGPVLHAIVMDSNGLQARELGDGQYAFDREPLYPLSAFGGVIDVNRDGTVSVGDVDNTLLFKAQEGKAATLVATVATQAQTRDWLKSTFGLTDEQIDNATPSTDTTIAAISDEVYSYCIENNITDPAQLDLQVMEQLQEQIANRIQTYKNSGASTAELEQQLMSELESNEVLQPLTVDQITQMQQGQNNGGMDAIIQLALSLPTNTLTEEQKYTLAYMWNEEKLAKDIYNALYEKWGQQTFTNIATKSETEHEAAVEAMVRKYDLNITNPDGYSGGYSAEELAAIAPGEYTIEELKALYETLLQKGDASLQDALEVGCMVEVTDVNDLDQDIAIDANDEDIKLILTALRSGSYNHYWAFDQALKSIGVADGCCVLGDEYCKTPEEYPQTSGGQTNGNGGAGTATPGQGNMGQGNAAHGTAGTPAADVNNTINTTPVVELTQDQIDTLAYMWNEEKLAKDIYMNLYTYFGEDPALQVLYNISTNSEVQHEATVQALLQKYDLNIAQTDTVTAGYDGAALDAIPSGAYSVTAVQELYDTLYAKGTQSVQDALEVGCMVEVTDVDDLDRDLEIVSGVEDITQAYEFLRSGSYNHYWAFDRALKNIGVADGCCSLGAEYCKTPEEFPQTNGGGNH